jgi:hypothetical protein
MKRLIIGIDLGKQGAICIRDGEEIETLVMPLLDGEIDERALADLFLEIASEVKMVAFETIFALKGHGGNSMINFGEQAGVIRGILSALKIPYKRVAARAWQSKLLKDVTGSDTKVKALKVASSLFPGVELKATERSRIAHPGIVDALLISEYARVSIC